MSQRISALTRYFLRSLSLSLTGGFYVILGLAFWALAFPPGQNTPEASYYILILAAFGVAMTFLATLTISARANQAIHYPWIVRLPSRVEYLTAVFLAATFFAFGLQLLVALLALFRGPDLTTGMIVAIPPIWISLNVLTAVIALHATDFVSSGWSRVYLFGIIAIFLIGQSLNSINSSSSWFIVQLNTLSRTLMGQGLFVLVAPLNEFSNWLQSGGTSSLSRLFSLPFWPFHAIANAVVLGSFNVMQAFAPAVLLLYATLLIMLAADLFATKDLELIE